MAKLATIRQANGFITVATPENTPLDGEIYATLALPLTYTYRNQKYGHDAYDQPTGIHQGVETETRRLYSFDNGNRFFCMRGWLPRITQLLCENEYDVEVFNHDPPKLHEPYAANWQRVISRYTFRPQQDICLAHIDMHDGGIIDAVPAFGKSYIMGMVCNLYPKAKIDIVSKSKSVVQTIINHISKYVANVGQVGGGRRRKSRVTVYTADSLKHSSFDADIVLADEVHELMTDRYSELLGRYAHSRMYGFTATKETRFDGLHHRMEGLFGPTIFYMPFKQAEQLGLVTPVVTQWINVDMPVNPITNIMDPVAKKRIGIWRNEPRNRIIGNTTRAFHDLGLQTLVLVETFDHGMFLRPWMPEDVQFCYSEQCCSDTDRRDEYIQWGMLDPMERMTDRKRMRMQRQFENREFMLGMSTSVWSTGVSFDSLEVLIRADASGSKTQNTQAPGRVCRIDGLKDAGILVDFWDMWDDGFLERSKRRRTDYAGHEWPQYMPDGKLWKPRRRVRVGTRR